MTFEESLRAAVREEIRPLREALDSLRSSLPETAAARDEVLSVEQVASICKVEPPTVRTWISSRRLKASKPGHRWLIERAELERFRAGQRERPTVDVDAQVSNILSRVARKGAR